MINYDILSLIDFGVGLHQDRLTLRLGIPFFLLIATCNLILFPHGNFQRILRIVTGSNFLTLRRLLLGREYVLHLVLGCTHARLLS